MIKGLNFEGLKLFGMKKSFLLLFTLVLMLPFALKAQQITFSEPDTDDPRSYSFEVLGKIGGKILVYKNYRDGHTLSELSGKNLRPHSHHSAPALHDFQKRLPR